PNASGTVCISGQACALTGNVTASGTPLSGRIAYFTGDTAVTGDSTFLWDTSNKLFTVTGGTTLTTGGSITTSGTYVHTGGATETGNLANITVTDATAANT